MEPQRGRMANPLAVLGCRPITTLFSEYYIQGYSMDRPLSARNTDESGVPVFVGIKRTTGLDDRGDNTSVDI